MGKMKGMRLTIFEAEFLRFRQRTDTLYELEWKGRDFKISKAIFSGLRHSF